MRKHWIDNLRWVTVLLVLLYHVVYFYNNKGVFGGVGGFGDGPQYQDTLMYLLYPWFMPLLFLLAGIGSRYSLEKLPAREWFRNRTRKLLVPATIGLLVLQWMTGYFNTVVAGRGAALEGVPFVAKYLMCAVSGIGPLWFIQDLWLFSLILLVIRKIDRKERLYHWCGKLSKALRYGKIRENIWIELLFLLFLLGEQTLVFNPRPESLDGLWNLYKPAFYIIPFLLGYYFFSLDSVQESLGKYWILNMAAAAIFGILLTATTFGQDNTTPHYLADPLNCLYGWLMCLAMMGWFKAKFDRTGRFAAYMTRSSFGLYIVHYLVIASLGYMMYHYTSLPPVAMYGILTVAVFALSPLLYELLSRIPIVRWCVFGLKGGKDHQKDRREVKKLNCSLETERILMRPWREEDAPALFKYASDPEVGPRAGWPPHKSVEESLQIIRTLFSGDHMWAIELKETGEAIGCMGYFVHGESNINIGENDAEVGYWVARPYWNQGICSEALRRLIDYCFREKGFDTLWSDYFPDNPASGRVMEKCGFRDTGEINYCSQLQLGSDRPVKIMKLSRRGV
ncbi:MAG: GNAT family N-acetyltransferase [Bacteroidales bacterium]|nr:GNAT family N-acetyltransferase [Bacteroidales bacterium]